MGKIPPNDNARPRLHPPAMTGRGTSLRSAAGNWLAPPILYQNLFAAVSARSGRSLGGWICETASPDHKSPPNKGGNANAKKRIHQKDSIIKASKPEEIIFFIASPPRQTNDTLNVGHKVKRYIFVPKTVFVKPKGIF